MYASVEMIKDSVNSFVQHATVDMTKLEWAITKNLSSQTTVDVVMKSTSYPPHPSRHSQKYGYSHCSKNYKTLPQSIPWVKSSTHLTVSMRVRTSRVSEEKSSPSSMISSVSSKSVTEGKLISASKGTATCCIACTLGSTGAFLPPLKEKKRQTSTQTSTPKHLKGTLHSNRIDKQTEIYQPWLLGSGSILWS